MNIHSTFPRMHRASVFHRALVEAHTHPSGIEKERAWWGKKLKTKIEPPIHGRGGMHVCWDYYAFSCCWFEAATTTTRSNRLGSTNPAACQPLRRTSFSPYLTPLSLFRMHWHRPLLGWCFIFFSILLLRMIVAILRSLTT